MAGVEEVMSSQETPGSESMAHRPNGLSGSTQSEEDFREQEEDHIFERLSQMQDSAIVPVKEDLSHWIHGLTGVTINADTFMNELDSGIVLCTIAKLIEKKAREMEAEGKLKKPLPKYELKCNNKAKMSWFAIDNVANFLGWCKAYDMADTFIFDPEDLVKHKQEKPVVNCVMELARIAYKFGIEPPSLIRVEMEVEEEKETASPPPKVQKKVPKGKGKSPVLKDEFAELERQVRLITDKYNCSEYVVRDKTRRYNIHTARGRKSVIISKPDGGKELMVRVGGGWFKLEDFLLHHLPIQVKEHQRPGHGGKFMAICTK